MKFPKNIRWPQDSTLKIINRILVILIVLVNGYVLLGPLLPRLNYEIATKITKPVQIDTNNPNSVASIDKNSNHLIIPAIQLDRPIAEGTNEFALSGGKVWRRPQTSTPDKGSNTVIVGHRFTYDGDGVFYSLDKLSIGDDIYAVYDGKIYHYRVSTRQVVSPNAVEVENPSSESILTIYTCTPLLTAKDRLVYTADLKEVL